jgi:AraC family transcriptional regulator of adaptative response/methylated-DNA-[protein]-cysteine methyltransferase
MEPQTLYQKTIQTPLGPMIAIGDDHSLYLLEYEDHFDLVGQIDEVRAEAPILPGSALAIESIEKELAAYYKKESIEFKTPITTIGTPFQNKVWQAIQQIPYGQTKSYQEVAGMIENPKACRAVGTANGRNKFPILIPCHRVISADGTLGGYSGRLERKIWLLEHEKHR